MSVRILIFSDLDSTLLDHYTYSWDEAKPVISLLKGLNIPLIFNTSKTFYETRRIAAEMGINHPFAVENGAAVFFPKGFKPLPEGCRITGTTAS